MTHRPDRYQKPAIAPYRDAPTWLFVACLIVTIVGLTRSNVLTERLWQPQLATQTLVLFAAVGVAALGCIVVAIRAHFRTEALLALLLGLVAAAMCGPGPTAVVLTFLLSSWCLGVLALAPFRGATDQLAPSVAIVTGWAIFTLLFSMLAPFPYNTTATHVILLAAPIALASALAPIRAEFIARSVIFFAPTERATRGHAIYLAGLVACVVVLSLHLAMVALPERYYDAMVMHLYVPSFVAAHRAWSYDASIYSFAFMPIGADMLYTHMFLLQGEIAARLLNFTAFLFTCIATFQIASAACSRPAAVWAVALLVSLPLTLIESATLFTENVITVFVTTAVLVLITSRFRVGLAGYVSILILLAGASVVKLHGVFAAGALGGAAAVLYVRHARPAPRWIVFLLVSFASAGAALWPYLYSWVRTGNPVLPLFNSIFKSPLFPPVEFVDSRWVGKMSASILYEMTFATNNFVEAYNGALGFAFLVFLGAGLLAALVRRNAIVLFCAGTGLLMIAALSVKTQYLRYLLIFFPLLTAAIAFALFHLGQIRFMRAPLALVLGATFLLNVYKMPAGGWILGVSDLRACCSKNLRRQLEIGQAPERVVNRIVNEVAGPLARVFYVNNPFGGLLNGTAIYSAWYNTRDSADLGSLATDEQFRAVMARIAPTHLVTTTGDTTQLGRLAANYVQAHGTVVSQVGALTLYKM